MTEIFPNVRDEVRKCGETAWKIAMAQITPDKAAQFLNTVIEYYKHSYTEEEINFLHFYFQTQMEMANNE